MAEWASRTWNKKKSDCRRAWRATAGQRQKTKTYMGLKRGSARRPTNFIWSRPPKNFFFRIFLVKMKDHIKKLLNPKYEAFLTILWKNVTDHNFEIFWVRPKKTFFQILIVFWDFLSLSSSLWVESGLKRCRKDFSTKLSPTVVITITFSKRSSLYKEGGVYSLWEWKYQ